MPVTCWVCGEAIAPDEPSVAARNVPRCYVSREGMPVHLRCHGEWDSVRVIRERPAARVPSVPTPPPGPRLLFAEDVAGMRGMSTRSARRWLVQLEERYGTAVVGTLRGRNGVRRFTTEAALESVSPRAERERRDLHELVAAIADRVEALERRLGDARRPEGARASRGG